MDLRQEPYPALALPGPASQPNRRLGGWALVLAWIGVAAMGALVIGVWVASIVADFRLSAPGFSATTIALVLTLNIGFLLGYLIPAAIMIWQRPRDWLALLAG